MIRPGSDDPILAALRGRSVLVTGARGFIGGALCSALLEAGAEVHGTTRGEIPQDDDGEAAPLWWRCDPAAPGEIESPPPRAGRAVVGVLSQFAITNFSGITVTEISNSSKFSTFPLLLPAGSATATPPPTGSASPTVSAHQNRRTNTQPTQQPRQNQPANRTHDAWNVDLRG